MERWVFGSWARSCNLLKSLVEHTHLQDGENDRSQLTRLYFQKRTWLSRRGEGNCKRVGEEPKG